jgi:hypothetical protein
MGMPARNIDDNCEQNIASGFVLMRAVLALPSLPDLEQFNK